VNDHDEYYHDDHDRDGHDRDESDLFLLLNEVLYAIKHLQVGYHMQMPSFFQSKCFK